MTTQERLRPQAKQTPKKHVVQWRCWLCSHWFDLDARHSHWQTGRPDVGIRRTVRR